MDESTPLHKRVLMHSLLQKPVTSNRDNLKLCCKQTYRPRRVKNKGAMLVLAWNYLIFSVFYLLLKFEVISWSISRVWFAVFGLALLIAGLLADTRIGRYKVIRCSIWIMWISTVLATVSSVIAQLVEGYYSANTNVLVVLFIIVAIGFGGYLGSIVQLGLDQLHDASSTEIKSFTIWYTWTLFSSGLVVDFTLACLSKQYKIIILLFVSANVTLAVVLLLTCNHWLIKESVRQNSLKLVYKVIRYAIRNKYARQRSAFTYCEDELPSRIDFGKSNYGGPFTIEQVEDVKTFLRLIPIIVVGGTLAGAISVTSNFRDKLTELYTDSEVSESNLTNSNTLTKCFQKASFTHTIYYGAVILIVLHELLLYPMFHRCCRQLESLQKLTIGITGHIFLIFTLMVYEVVSRHSFISSHGHNTTIQCTFYVSPGTLSASFSYYWITIPDILFAVSMAMIYIGAFEFLSAQVPSSMKGLMIGTAFFTYLLSNTIWFVVSLPFNSVSSFWGTGTISCGFWYTFTLATVQICVCPFLIILTRWYKKRKRQDVLPNQHIFAERYYDKI